MLSPADYLDRDANNEIGQVISSLPGLSPESVKNWSALDPANGLFMWQAPLNDASVTKINHTKGVGLSYATFFSRLIHS